MSLLSNSARRIRAEELHVDGNAYPDWVSGKDRLPTAGSQVLCTAGLAEVVKVLGKTGDGSRLLELRLQGVNQPFFVAASNIRVAPVEETAA
jgi:hypothetical protein